MFPVISPIKFHTKALYDDVLTIDLTITCIKAARIYMEFTVYDAHKNVYIQQN